MVCDLIRIIREDLSACPGAPWAMADSRPKLLPLMSLLQNARRRRLAVASGG